MAFTFAICHRCGSGFAEACTFVLISLELPYYLEFQGPTRLTSEFAQIHLGVVFDSKIALA